MLTLRSLLGFRVSLSGIEFSYQYISDRAPGPLSEALLASPADAAAVSWHAAPAGQPHLSASSPREPRSGALPAWSDTFVLWIGSARMEPTHAQVYLAAVAYLTACWMTEFPDESLTVLLSEAERASVSRCQYSVLADAISEQVRH